MSNPPLDHISLFRIRIPLKCPYTLSFGEVTALDSLIVRATADGRAGWGESTPLPGYSRECLDDVHAFCKTTAITLSGTALSEALNACNTVAPAYRALTTPLVIALEELLGRTGGHATLRSLYAARERLDLPLMGIISTTDPELAKAQAREQHQSGYTGLKIKVALPGVDPLRDARICRAVREQCGPRVQLRADANQGYTYDQAIAFLCATQDLGLALLEQPFAPDAWDLQARLYREQRGTPLMLDESIVTSEDLERCIEMRCADWVKLKLNKQGGLLRTLDLAQRAEVAGLGVVLGNGVQSDLGCAQEARLHAAMNPAAIGEQNGFLKTTTPLLETAIHFEGGHMTLPDAEPCLRKVKALCVHEDHFGHERPS